jgi:hypothetical protein
MKFILKISKQLLMCFEAGDDPTSLIEETKHELQVIKRFHFGKKRSPKLFRKWLLK